MLEMIFSQILKMSLTAGVCIVVVSMLHLVFHRIPRKYLYALWIVVAFRLVCPVSVSTPVGLVLMGNVGQIEQTSVTDELVQSEQAVGDGRGVQMMYGRRLIRMWQELCRVNRWLEMEIP